jgi:hypothetical protein
MTASPENGLSWRIKAIKLLQVGNYSPVDMVLLPKILGSLSYLFPSSKLLVPVYQTTRRHMPENCNHIRRENLRSKNIKFGIKVLLCGSNHAL